MLHRYWACPLIADIPDEHKAIAKTEWMRARVTSDWMDMSCLTLRALLPANLAEFAADAVPEVPDFVFVGPFPAAACELANRLYRRVGR